MSETSIDGDLALPWDFDGCVRFEVLDHRNRYVAMDLAQRHAEAIVTAVNSHAAAERLAEAVRKVRKLDQEWQEVTLSKDVVRSHAVYSEIEDAKEELDDALAAYEASKGGGQS